MHNSKIGTLQTCFSTAWGGLEMVAFEVALKMQRSGHFITTVCPEGSPLYQRLCEAGLDVLPTQRRHRYFCPATVHLLRQAVKSGRYSTVLVEQMNELWRVVPALIGAREIRLVGISHTFLGICKKDWLHGWLYRRMDSLIALTEIHRQNLLDKLPITESVVQVLPNAVDLEKFHPCKRDERLRASLIKDAQELLIGVVSRLDLGKGVLQVVEVADRLRQLGVSFKLIIVGNETAGEEGAKGQLETEIARRNLQNQMRLVGHRSDIETVMASLDVLLMPSPIETFGRVLIEAMASGVAVVASGGGGVPNIVQHEQNGLLVPPLSIEAMAQAIAVYYKDPEKRRRIALNGRQVASERYDYRVLDQKLYAILGMQ